MRDGTGMHRPGTGPVIGHQTGLRGRYHAVDARDLVAVRDVASHRADGATEVAASTIPDRPWTRLRRPSQRATARPAQATVEPAGCQPPLLQAALHHPPVAPASADRRGAGACRPGSPRRTAGDRSRQAAADRADATAMRTADQLPWSAAGFTGASSNSGLPPAESSSCQSKAGFRSLRVARPSAGRMTVSNCSPLDL
jgi:hypothetical protein